MREQNDASQRESLWRAPGVFAAYLLLVLYMLCPAIVVAIAGALVAMGRESADARHTVIFGYDFGALEQTRDSLVSLLVFTVPTGAGALAILTLSIAMAAAVRRRRSTR